VTIIGPFFGAVGALGGAWLTRRERRNLEGTSWRKEAAVVVVPVQTLLLEADPERLPSEAAAARRAVAGLQRRWREELRDSVLVFAASHPSPDFARLVNELAGDTERTLDDLERAWTGRGAPRGADVEAARRARADGMARAAEVLEEVRRRRVPWRPRSR
jgi:hypothetical protein